MFQYAEKKITDDADKEQHQANGRGRISEIRNREVPDPTPDEVLSPGRTGMPTALPEAASPART